MVAQSPRTAYSPSAEKHATEIAVRRRAGCCIVAGGLGLGFADGGHAWNFTDPARCGAACAVRVRLSVGCARSVRGTERAASIFCTAISLWANMRRPTLSNGKGQVPCDCSIIFDAANDPCNCSVILDPATDERPQVCIDAERLLRGLWPTGRCVYRGPVSDETQYQSYVLNLLGTHAKESDF